MITIEFTIYIFLAKFSHSCKSDYGSRREYIHTHTAAKLGTCKICRFFSLFLSLLPFTSYVYIPLFSLFFIIDFGVLDTAFLICVVQKIAKQHGGFLKLDRISRTQCKIKTFKNLPWIFSISYVLDYRRSYHE